MKKILLSSLIASTLIGQAALAADEPSFSYIEGGYTQIDLDVDGFDPDGYYLGGSFAFTDYFFGTIDWIDTSDDINILGQSVGLDFEKTGFGIGINTDPSAGYSFYLAYELNQWELEGQDLDLDTFRGGVKTMLSPNFELNASISHNEIDIEGEPDDSETGYQIGLAYSLANNFQITFDYENIDDLDQTQLGVRYNF